MRLFKCTFKEMDFKEEQKLAVVVFKLLHYIPTDWSKNRGVIFSLVAAHLTVFSNTQASNIRLPHHLVILSVMLVALTGKY